MYFQFMMLDRYIKTKTRIYGDKVYTSFRDLNVSEDGAECEALTVISIDSLNVCENKYYLHVYLDKQIIHYLDDTLFKIDEG